MEIIMLSVDSFDLFKSFEVYFNNHWVWVNNYGDPIKRGIIIQHNEDNSIKADLS